MADESDVVLKRLLRLVQVTSNPNLIDASYQVEPGKLETLLELVSSIVRDGEKCIVWTSFVEQRRVAGKNSAPAQSSAGPRHVEHKGADRCDSHLSR